MCYLFIPLNTKTKINTHAWSLHQSWTETLRSRSMPLIICPSTITLIYINLECNVHIYSPLAFLQRHAKKYWPITLHAHSWTEILKRDYCSPIVLLHISGKYAHKTNSAHSPRLSCTIGYTSRVMLYLLCVDSHICCLFTVCPLLEVTFDLKKNICQEYCNAI